MTVLAPYPELVVHATAGLARLTRRKCPICGQQRVIIVLELALERPSDTTPLLLDREGRCAPCWGIR